MSSHAPSADAEQIASCFGCPDFSSWPEKSVDVATELEAGHSERHDLQGIRGASSAPDQSRTPKHSIMLYLIHLILLLPLAVVATLNEPCLGSGSRAGTFSSLTLH